MNIQEAMRAATDNQKNMRRASWMTGQLETVTKFGGERNGNPYIYTTLADCGREWRPSPDDLTADDWDTCERRTEPNTVEEPAATHKYTGRSTGIQTVAIWAVLFALCATVGFILARIL